MLIAATGLAGAGKSTMLRHLSTIWQGHYFYVGGIVREEVAHRGLPATPESEHQVRNLLRKEMGMAALARLAAPKLDTHLLSGVPVLIDAICNTEEAALYRQRFGNALVVIGIEASFATRAKRLAIREGRSMTEDQLRNRDVYELNDLRLGAVVTAADVVVRNEGSFADLWQNLEAVADQIVRG